MRGTRAVTAVQTIAAAVGDFRALEARWPQPEELFACDPALPRQDPWQRAFAFEATVDGGCLVRSAGVDGRFGTCDDVASWPIAPDGTFGASGTGATATSR